MKAHIQSFIKSFSVFTLLLFLSFSTDISAQTQKLRIKVKDSNNVAIKNANVVVTYNNQTQTKNTNFKGRTGFNVPSNTNVTVTINKENYEFTPESRTLFMNKKRVASFTGTFMESQPEGHNISVIVKDRNNNPMAGATVMILKDNNFTNELITGSNGTVQANYPNNTVLSVRVSKDGVEFEESTQNLTITADTNLVFNEVQLGNLPFTLTPNPVSNGEQLVVNVPTGTLHFNIKDENDNIIRSYGFDPYGGHTQISPTISDVEPGIYKAEIIGENIYDHYGVQDLEILAGNGSEDDTLLTIEALTNTGNAIQGATVTLNSDGQTYELTTDANGRVSRAFPLNSGVWGTIVKAGVIFENPNISISLNENTTLTFNEKPDTNFKEFVIAPNPLTNGGHLVISRAHSQHVGIVQSIYLIDQYNNIVKTFEWDNYNPFVSNSFHMYGFAPGIYYVRIIMFGKPIEVHPLIIQ